MERGRRVRQRHDDVSQYADEYHAGLEMFKCVRARLVSPLPTRLQRKRSIRLSPTPVRYYKLRPLITPTLPQYFRLHAYRTSFHQHSYPTTPGSLIRSYTVITKGYRRTSSWSTCRRIQSQLKRCRMRSREQWQQCVHGEGRAV